VNDAPAAPTGCRDEIKTTQNGDPKALGFPINYNPFLADGKPWSSRWRSASSR
jgi:hypothetical protein